MTRLAGPNPTHLSEATAELLTLASDSDGEPLLTVAVLAHNPPLLGPFLGWAAALALEGSLPKRVHELLALRTAVRCGSEFEFREHAGYAAAAGLTAVEIERTRVGPDAEGWNEMERLLMRAADELHDSNTMGADTWVALARDYDATALVEILYVVGQYTMLSMVANAVEGDKSAP
jgi:alkylhydroperoxidase family enzyme